MAVAPITWRHAMGDKSPKSKQKAKKQKDNVKEKARKDKAAQAAANAPK